MTRLLDLPPELLARVVALAVPSSFSEIDERHTALNTLACVCKALHELVADERYRVLVVRTRREAERVLRLVVQGRLDPNKVTSLSFQGDGFGEGEDEQGLFELVVKALPCLRLLRLYENLLEIDCLESLPFLRHLSLSSATISLSRPVILPALSTLSSFYSTSNEYTRLQLLNSTAVPSLRALVLHNAHYTAPSEHNYLQPCPSLFPQLALFSPNRNDTASWLAGYPAALLQIKVGAYEESLRRLLPTALGIRFYTASWAGRYDEHDPARAETLNIRLRYTLSTLLRVVSAHPNPLPHLRLVSVPPLHYPAYSSEHEHLATVTAALADLDIECIVEENLDGELDSLVSLRCLELALEAQAEEQG